jgi:hypothetical protein
MRENQTVEFYRRMEEKYTFAAIHHTALCSQSHH